MQDTAAKFSFAQEARPHCIGDTKDCCAFPRLEMAREEWRRARGNLMTLG